MQYFAEVDSNGLVLRVIVADQSFIDSGLVGDPKNWVETFKDGSNKKNFAGIGHTYNKTLDAFVPPKSFPSWTLDQVKGQYTAPVIQPKDGKPYVWNEVNQAWDLDTETINKESTKTQ